MEQWIIEAYFLCFNLSAKPRLKLFFGAVIKKYTVCMVNVIGSDPPKCQTSN